MKVYLSEKQLCLVGKGWEVRRYLQKLSTPSSNGHTALVTTLDQRTSQKTPTKKERINVPQDVEKPQVEKGITCGKFTGRL